MASPLTSASGRGTRSVVTSSSIADRFKETNSAGVDTGLPPNPNPSSSKPFAPTEYRAIVMNRLVQDPTAEVMTYAAYNPVTPLGPSVGRPAIEFVNYDQNAINVFDNAITVLDRFLATGRPLPESMRKLLTSAQTAQQGRGQTFLSVDAENATLSVATGSGDVAGQSLTDIYAVNRDADIETVVRTGDLGTFRNGYEVVAVLDRMWHEFAHKNGVHGYQRPGGATPVGRIAANLTVITAQNYRTLDVAGGSGYDFIQFLRDNGFTYRNSSGNNVAITTDNIDDYYMDGNGTTPGVFKIAAENAENSRLRGLHADVKSLFDSGQQSQLSPDTLARLRAQDIIKLRGDAPSDPAAREAYLNNPANYRMRSLPKVDYDGLDNIFGAPVDSDPFEEFIDGVKQFGEAVFDGLTTFDPAQLGIAFGSVLGRRITSDPFGQVAASATLSTVLGAVGEALDKHVFHGTPSTHILDKGLESFGSTLLENLKGAAIGAISSYLTAELVEALGIGGIPGELANSVGSTVITQLISNIPRVGDAIRSGTEIVGYRNLFTDIGPNMVISAVASYVGNKLANEIHTFKSIGGQIGSAVGSAYASFLAKPLLMSGNPALIAAAVAIIVVANLLGGTLGSIFGGTPRSGADVAWDPSSGDFVVANIYSRKGGSKDAAKSLAGAVANNLNSVRDLTGATLLDPGSVQTGNYGMRYSNYVYRPTSTRDKEAITATFKGKTGAQDLITHGTYLALSDMAGQLAGGNVYVKRALAASLLMAEGNSASDRNGAAGRFNLTTLMGDLSIGDDYGRFMADQSTIKLLMAVDPQTGFTAGWTITLARAAELGLNRRNETDWIGGYGVMLDEGLDGRIGGDKLIASQLKMDIDPATGLRIAVATNGDGSFAGVIQDTIEAGSDTMIEGTANADVITLTHAATAIGRGANLLDASGWPKDPASLPAGPATLSGWMNSSNNVNETKWASVLGPDGKAVAAIEAGQTDSMSEGGGNHSNLVAIDPTKEYEFTIWFQKKDLTSQDVHFAIQGEQPAGAYLRDATTGAVVSGAGYVATLLTAEQQASLVEDRWYKVVGYVLPSGSANIAAGSRGGVFDGVTGQKVRDTLAFRWNDTLPTSKVRSFFSNSNAAASNAFTTYYYKPEVRQVVETAMVGGADRFVHTPGLKVDGWAGDGSTVSIDVAATIAAGAGDDVVHGGDMGNNVYGEAGNDTLYGGKLDDWLMGGAGNDTLNAGAANGAGAGGNGNYLEGGAGDDILIGREGSDWLEGGEGTDTLEGGRGEDILAGGAGKGDVLRGGLGDDHYVFRKGDSDGSTLEADADKVRDESGFTMQQLVTKVSPRAMTLATVIGEVLFRRFGLGSWTGSKVATDVSTSTSTVVQAGGQDALVMDVGITIEDIRISPNAAKTDLIIEITETGEKIVLQDWFNPLNQIETIRFADGQELRIADFDTFTLGTNGADYVYGTNANDFVHAGDGNDVVYLLFGNDFGNGGKGNDFVSGDPGRDIVVGMDGNDIALGGADSDTVSGGAGDDEVRGGTGNDVVAGGSGRDFVSGGAGDDVLKFTRGDGTDTFVDELSAEWDVVWVSGQGFKGTYRAGTGAEAGHIYDGSVRIYDGASWGARFEYDVATGILYRHKPANAAQIAANSGVDTIEFAIGIDAGEIQIRTVGADLVLGIEPSGGTLGGFDSLTDKIVLKEWATNSAAKNSIEKFGFFSSGTLEVAKLTMLGGTDGNDSGAAKISGLDLTKGHWAAGGKGDDELVGSYVNDLLSGQSGADWLKGSFGADILLGGIGHDILDGGAGGSFYEGSLSDALGNQVSGATATSAGDTLVGGEGFDIASYASATAGVVASLIAPANNSGDAALDKYSEIEGLEGSAHADILRGDQANNELSGRKGNDQLEGNLGDDTYVFGRADGQDVVYDQFAPVTETIVNASGALGADWVDRVDMVSRSGTTYQFMHRIEHAETGEVVYQRQFGSTLGAPGVPVRQADGWLPGEGGAAQFTFTGSQVTRGEPQQAAGDDTLFIDDITVRNGSTDTGIQTVGLSNLTFTFSGADLIVAIEGTTDSIRLANFRNAGAATFDSARGIENLVLADGERSLLKGLVFDASGILLTAGTTADDLIVDMVAGGHMLTGGQGGDTLSGRDGIDTLDGGEGDDLLAGGAQADALIGGSGSDTATWFGSSGFVTVDLAANTATGGDAESDTFNSVENLIGSDHGDTLRGNEAGNSLQGNAGNDTLEGRAGQDALQGDSGADGLLGGTADDILDGGEDNDTLTGGEDNDLLLGGAGDDTLIGDSSTADASGAGIASTFDRIVNGGFEDLGEAGDAAVAGGTASADLPGWKTTTGSSFLVAGAAGSRRLALDGGTANLEVAQTITGIGAGQAMTLSFNSANTAGASGAFEVWWNSEKLATIGAGGTYSYAVTGTASGTNMIRFVGLGAADGAGATIDTVQLLGSGGGFDTLAGGDGNDLLYGGAGGDGLVGGDGADTLQGGAGNDALEGGRGNDQLLGGAGDDSYIVFGDGGIDTITTGGGQDSIVFGMAAEGSRTALTPDSIRLAQLGLDLLISVAGTSTSVRVVGWFASATAKTPSANAARRIIAGGKAITQTDVAGLLAEMERIGSGAADAQYNGVFARVWQPIESFMDRFLVQGTAGADTLSAAHLIGGGRLEGLAGDDVIDGTGFNDVIVGGAGADTIRAGEGDDELHYFAEAGFDSVDGGSGNDRIVAQADNAVIGLSSITGVEAIDGNGKSNVQIQLGTPGTLDLSSIALGGIARIVGSAGADTIVGGKEIDVIEGGAGADTLRGGEGDDQLVGGVGVDVLDGGAGQDTAMFNTVAVPLTVDLGLGTASYSGGSASLVSIEHVVGGAGNDSITGNEGSNWLGGNSGDDILIGGGGDDTLRGALGIDRLEGGAGFDIADYSEKTTALTLSVATGGTVDGGNEVFVGMEGIIGGSAGDSLTGSALADSLAGSGGGDVLSGGGGDDLLEGGAGNDTLDGGAGTNTAIFQGNRAGYVVDTAARTITDIDPTNGDEGIDTYILNTIGNLRFADVTISLGISTNNAPKLGLPNLANQIGFDNQAFSYAFPATAFLDLDLTDTLSFTATKADGTALPSWLIFDGPNRTFSYAANAPAGVTSLEIVVTAADGSAAGSASISSSFTLSIVPGPGAPIVGTAANETVTGTSRPESVSGLDGNDLVTGGGGGDTIDGGLGNDWAGYGTSPAGVQVNLLTGLTKGGDAEGDVLTGIEWLQGSNFADVLVGDGLANTIYAFDGDDRIEGGAGDDTLSGQGGIDTVFGGDGNDIVQARKTATGRIEDYVDGGNGIDLLRIVGDPMPAIVSLEDPNIVSFENLVGGDFGDTLTGNAAANVVNAGLGADMVFGQDGGDTLYGEGGNDTLDGGLGSDTLDGGADNDVLNGGAGIDTLHGGLGADTLDGGSEADVINGNDGDDILKGGAGADTYDGGLGIDTLDFSAATELVKLNLSAVVALTLNPNYGSAGDAAGDTYIANTIENVIGSALGDTIVTGNGANLVRGGAGNDAVNSGADNDSLYGEAGADSLRGQEGNDFLSGGLDNDILWAGSGDDTVQGDEGDDTLSGEGGVDNIQGGAGNDTISGNITGGSLGPDNVADTLSGGDGDDQFLLVGDARDNVDGGAGIDTVSFTQVTSAATAVTVDLADTLNHKIQNVENLLGGAGGDTLLGSALANRIDGNGGNDTLDGRAGADILIGGSLPDNGIDTVTYASMSVAEAAPVASAAVGAVVVNTPTPTTLATAVNISLNGVRVDLVANSSTSLTGLVGATAAAGGDAQGDWFYSVENLVGSKFNDQLRGTASSTLVDGGAGDDLIYGGAGNDTLTGGGGNDIVYGEAGVDNLWGGADNDRLFGDGAGDYLYGEGGNDYLDAGDAGDVLVGGTGIDTLIGGNGADTYRFKRGDGADTIYNYDDDTARDSVEFFYDPQNLAASIYNTDLWFTKSGTDLIVSVLGTTDKLTVKSWFSNAAAGDWTAADSFAIDIFMSASGTTPGGVVNDKIVNMPTLLSLMKDVTPPASAAAMDAGLRSRIDSAWSGNTAPTVAAVAGNAVSTSEGLAVDLRFRLTDVETVNPGTLTLSVAVGNTGIFQAVAASDITVDPTDAAVRIVKVRPVSNSHGLTTLTLKASDGYIETHVPLTYNLRLLARYDIVAMAAATSVMTSAGAQVTVPGTLAAITDTDSEVFHHVHVLGLPVGTVISDGVHSYTATGEAFADITGWNSKTLANLRITPTAGSAADFTVTIRAASLENLPSADVDPGWLISPEYTTTIRVNVNGKPTGVTLTNSSPLFAENSGDVAVGTLSAVDPGDTDADDPAGVYAYEIVGAAAQAIFEIVGTNQLRVRPGQSLDFEAGNYSLGIKVTDNTNPAAPLSDTYYVNVRPANVNERPGTPAAGSGSVNENVGAGTIVSGLTLSAVDPENDALSYAIVGYSKDWFEVYGNQLRVKAGAAINYEAATGGASSVTVDVVASDSSLTSLTARTYTIAIGPVDEAPSVTLNPTSVAVTESNSGVWSGVALGGSDPEGTALSWEIDQTRGAAAAFTIVGSTLKLASALDFEQRPAGFGAAAGGQSSTAIWVRSNSGGMSSAWQQFSFTLQDVNEAPSQPSPFAASITEWTAGDAPNLVIATLGGSTDPEGSGVTYNFAAGGNTNAWFEIVGNQLRVSAAAWGNGFNYEYFAANGLSPSINVSIVASDTVNVSTVQTSTITVLNKNEAPVAANDVVAGPNEDQGSFAIATSTLLANDTDVDAGDSRSVAAVSGVSQYGASVGLSGGTIYYYPGSVFNGLAAGQVLRDSFTYVVSDAGGLTSSATAYIDITGVNDAPTITGITYLYPNGITEGAVVNTPLAVISVSDVDGAQGSHVLTVSDPALKAVWNASAGRYELQVANGLDYEGATMQAGGPTGKYLGATVTASDGYASSAGAAVAVNVGNIVLNVWTPPGPALNPDFRPESYSTPYGQFLGGYEEPGYGGQASSYFNEWLLRHVPSGRVIAYYSEVHRYPNTTSRRPETSAHYAEGYTVSGTWPNFTVYSSDEHNTNEVGGYFGGGYPIGLDLGGDGLQLVESTQSGVSFDINADGLADRTGWVGPQDGLLALDRDGSGAIEDGAEISFVRDKPGAKTDLEGLAGFDSNGDMILDARDERFGDFKVWQDSNQDGISQASELRSLAEAGIVYLSLTGTATGQSLMSTSGNVVLATAGFGLADGSRRELSDLVLRYQGQPYAGWVDPAEGPPAASLATAVSAGAAAGVAAGAVPIVLDLDGDGLDLIGLTASKVLFDWAGNGSAERSAWVAASDGLLVLDRNGNGKIDDAVEISFAGDKAGAKTGFEGLAALDANGDGRISAADTRFGELKVWQDLNQDGVSQADELKSLTAAGISSIDLAGVSTGQAAQEAAQSVILNVSRFTRADGSQGMAGDVALARQGGATSPAGATASPTASPPSGTAPAAPESGAGQAAPTPAPAAESASAPTPPAAGEALPGAATPATGDASAPATGVEPRPIAFANRHYDRKAKHYRMLSEDGALMVVARKARGEVDPRAAAIAPASLLAFGNRKFGMLAPIILDLDGDGVEMRSIAKSKARFDMDGDGSRDDTGWTGKGDGFLVIDRNGDGRITGAAELSFLSEKAGARSDLEALTALDANRDGKLDSSDARFAELKVWNDANGNGVTDAGELRSLAEHDIASIGLAGRAVRSEAAIGENMLLATATFTRTDGSTGTAGDAALAFKPGGSGLASLIERQISTMRREVKHQPGMDAPASHDPAPADQPGAPDVAADRRLALIAQEMASFGTRSGEGEWRRNEAAIARFDYFAA